MADELVARLSGVDLFAGLSPRVLARIADSGHEAAYEPGSPVVVQGDSVAGYKAFSPGGVEMHFGFPIASKAIPYTPAEDIEGFHFSDPSIGICE